MRENEPENISDTVVPHVFDGIYGKVFLSEVATIALTIRVSLHKLREGGVCDTCGYRMARIAHINH
jgi:hypothetical protein